MGGGKGGQVLLVGPLLLALALAFLLARVQAQEKQEASVSNGERIYSTATGSVSTCGRMG